MFSFASSPFKNSFRIKVHWTLFFTDVCSVGLVVDRASPLRMVLNIFEIIKPFVLRRSLAGNAFSVFLCKCTISVVERSFSFGAYSAGTPHLSN